MVVFVEVSFSRILTNPELLVCGAEAPKIYRCKMNRNGHSIRASDKSRNEFRTRSADRIQLDSFVADYLGSG